jgi:hypothetical protein
VTTGTRQPLANGEHGASIINARGAVTHRRRAALRRAAAASPRRVLSAAVSRTKKNRAAVSSAAHQRRCKASGSSCIHACSTRYWGAVGISTSGSHWQMASTAPQSCVLLAGAGEHGTARPARTSRLAVTALTRQPTGSIATPSWAWPSSTGQCVRSSARPACAVRARPTSKTVPRPATARQALRRGES